MKIFVIDNTWQIQPLLLTAEADVTFYTDEILALNAVELQSPVLVLLNYAVRGKQSARYIDLLLLTSPSTNIVVIGDNLPDEQVLETLLIGAKGYQNSRELAKYAEKIIKVIAQGEAWISRRMTAQLLDAIRQQNSAISNKLAPSCLSPKSETDYQHTETDH